MISQLFNSPTISMLERTLSFTEQRHQVILENISNVSTPGYVQQDVSVSDFQTSLRNAIAKTRNAYNVPLEPESTDTVEFTGDHVQIKPQQVVTSTGFHDRGIRSPEKLMTDLADNATAHNLAATLLRSKYDGLKQAISMRA